MWFLNVLKPLNFEHYESSRWSVCHSMVIRPCFGMTSARGVRMARGARNISDGLVLHFWHHWQTQRSDGRHQFWKGKNNFGYACGSKYGPIEMIISDSISIITSVIIEHILSCLLFSIYLSLWYHYSSAYCAILCHQSAWFFDPWGAVPGNVLPFPFQQPFRRQAITTRIVCSMWPKQFDFYKKISIVHVNYI